jgi:hypothetical protein
LTGDDANSAVPTQRKKKEERKKKISVSAGTFFQTINEINHH